MSSTVHGTRRVDTSRLRRWLPRVVAVLAVQLALVAVAVLPQLSARTTGDEYLFRVQPYDPVEPFRGAYVDLDYPDLRLEGDEVSRLESGTVYLTLVEQDGVWVRDTISTTRPAEGPYLACDNHGWRLSCGMESLFLPQDKAASHQELLGSGTAVAHVRIDSRGHAALMSVTRG
ncbi:MAG: GDYXXLXY domain-containing protein [Nocardioides sp.]